LLDAGLFHCQQAAEKALKAYLTEHDINFRKTHDLVLLLDDCINKDAGVSQFSEYAIMLTPLAVEFRYPGNVDLPDNETTRTLFKMAREILAYVKSALGR